MKTIYNHIKNNIKSNIYKVYDWNNLRVSKKYNISDLETVCLLLGPYRNLTTILSSTLYLHPNCQVLNHAGPRIHGKKEIDFFSNYSPKIFNNFIRFSIEISRKGEAGSYGGSITKSHAFDSKTLKNIYRKSEVKKAQSIKSLVWKESLINTNLIKSDKFSLSNVIEREKRLRFMLPIRNPLDCTISNIKTGHAKIFKGINQNYTAFDILESIIEEIHWFILKKQEYPDRFFYFFENDISKNLFLDIANFLKLNADKTWVINAESAFLVKSGYKHDSELVKFYKKLIKNRFYKYPSIIDKFLSFNY